MPKLETIVAQLPCRSRSGRGGILWSRLRRPEASSSSPSANADEGGCAIGLAKALGDPSLDVAYRLATAATSTRPAAGRVAARRRPCRYAGDSRRRRSRRADSRSRVARRTGPRRVRSRHRRARARERTPGGRGAVAASGGTSVPRSDGRRGRRRAPPHRAQPPRRSAATAGDIVARARPRSFPYRSRCSRRSLARTGRGRARDRRAPRARAESIRPCSGTRAPSSDRALARAHPYR